MVLMYTGQKVMISQMNMLFMDGLNNTHKSLMMKNKYSLDLPLMKMIVLEITIHLETEPYYSQLTKITF
jgi:hypothetical protein